MAIVRHPMYSAALPLVIFTPLALGSYWGLIVVVATLPALIWRLLDEERVLKLDLPGYREYCVKMRYRLIPRRLVSAGYFSAFSALSRLSQFLERLALDLRILEIERLHRLAPAPPPRPCA